MGKCVARDSLQVTIEGNDAPVVREALAAARVFDVVQPVLTSVGGIASLSWKQWT